MNKCDVIQPLIIKNHVDDITNEELIFVKEHLKSCKKCRHYESTLKNLHNSMQTGKSQKLVPNPNIRQTLLSQLKPHKTTRLDIFGNIWQNITRIFEYRIPVYQAVLGLTFAFFSLLYYKSGKSPRLSDFFRRHEYNDRGFHKFYKRNENT